MSKKKLGARAERRELARQTEKLIRDKERLFLLDPGGSAGRPIELVSASEKAGVADCADVHAA